MIVESDVDMIKYMSNENPRDIHSKKSCSNEHVSYNIQSVTHSINDDHENLLNKCDNKYST